MTSTHQEFVRTDMWREGTWLDMWSVVHVLSGVSVGLGFYFLQLGALASVALAFVSLVAYELWEAMVKIEEAPTNRFMDVVVGMVGFLPAFFLISPSFSSFALVVTFIGVFSINVVLAAVGWHASKKAAQLEQRMRMRFSSQRARFIERRRRAHARIAKK